jgi:hypothetical protein
MMFVRTVAFACVVLSLLTMNSRPAAAQTRGGARGTPAGGTFEPSGTDPMVGPVVTGAPFSAEAITTVTQTLSDGTRIEQRTTAKFYRDGAGRVRREQSIMGLDALNPSTEAQTVITIDIEPGDGMVYLLDPVARTARRMPRMLFSTGALSGAIYSLGMGARGNVNIRLRLPGQGDAPVLGQGVAVARRGAPGDLASTEEQLGMRQIDGVRATGRRTTTTIPIDRIGNDRPIQITDERWESPELKLMISSRFSDPRTGVVEYRLANINRAEPPADLFMVPTDYTIIGPPPPPPPAPQPGVVGGAPGVGGRGQRGRAQ